MWVVLDRLSDIILAHNKGCIVEIGIGYSSEILLKHAIALNRKFYTCDISKTRCDELKNKTNYDKLYIYNMKSNKFMLQFNDIPSLVFIDGNHFAKVLKPETKFFLEKMNYGAVMFLHDTCPTKSKYESKTAHGRIMDTYTVRQELEQDKNLDVFTWRYTAKDAGLTMIWKKDLRDPMYRN